MRASEISLFVEYLAWVNGRLLDAADRLVPGTFAATAGDTVRDLRSTLVHELDVEWSWRMVLQGLPEEEWGSAQEMQAEDFEDLASLRARWTTEDAELHRWVASLTDEGLAEPVTPGLSNRELPLWYFVMHIVTHGMQQQADVATLLTAAGASPGEIGFLEFVGERAAAGRLPPERP